jgi:hypothetical protein
MKLFFIVNIILSLLFVNIDSDNYVDREYHIIRNETDMDYLDEIVHIGLMELGIGKVRVTIKPMDTKVKYLVQSRNNQLLDAFIKGNGTRYVIYVSKFSKWKSIEIISHELIHLKQYYSDDLQICKGEVAYKKKIYRGARYLEYTERPWETDAYSEGRKLKIFIEKSMKL